MRETFMKKSLIVGAMLPLFGTSAAWAEQTGNTGPVYDSFLNLMPMGNLVDSMSLDQLANMVVTESKMAQSQDSVTQKIVVLHASDIEQQTGYNRNLAELMRYSSGQFVNVLSRNDASWGSYAGLGPKYNSYLLDGLPIDSFADGMSLDPWAFERVEAYKGPASVLYANYLSMDFAGNQTPLTGTTNFILKDRVDVPMTRAQVGIGSYNTSNGRVYLQSKSGNLSYLVGSNYERSDYTQYGAVGSWLQTTKRPEYDKLKVYGKLSYAFDGGDHRLSLFVHRTEHKGDAGRPSRDFKHAYDTINLAYNKPLSQNLNLQAKLGQRDYDRRSGNDGYDFNANRTSASNLLSTGNDSTKQRIVPMDMTLNYTHGSGLLTIGVDRQSVHYQTAAISTAGVATPDNDVTARSSGLFVQEKYQIGDWVLRAGARRNNIEHDYRLLGGNTPTAGTASWDRNLWSLGVRYNVAPTLSLYANAGSSFMAPASKQVGGTIAAGSGLNGQLPNPGLAPENGLGTDVGVDWHPGKSLNVGMRLFSNRIQNAIIDNVVSAAPSQSQSINAGEATSNGFEIDVRHTWSDTVQWFGNLTYTKTEVNSPNDRVNSGAAIPFAPDYVVNLGLTTQFLGFTVSPYLHQVGRYYDSTTLGSRQAFGHYGVVNVRVQKNLQRTADHSLNLTVDVNNLLDKRFDMPWGFIDPGRSLFASLNLVF
jgi:outer membrane receptor protein involved in Fe transport